MIKGVPDIISFTRMSQASSQLRARMEAASLEAVTGKHADIPAATGAKIGEANLVKKALSDIESRASQYGIVTARIDTMSAALDNVHETIGDLGMRAFSFLDTPDPTTLRTLAVEAEVGIHSIFSMLNANQGNRTLFSGDAVQTSPLQNAEKMIADVGAIMGSSGDPASVEAALDAYFNDPDGGFATDIYQGGQSNASSLVLANGTRVDYTVRADDQAVRDSLRGLAVLANTDQVAMSRPGAEFKAFMSNELSVLESGKTGIVEAQARLGVAQQAISRAVENDSSERTILSAVYQTLVGRDQYEAAAELKQIETQLEASYLLTSRLSQLNLANFI